MPSVLIVDDSMVMRRTLASLFERAGYNVAGEAVNGEMAVVKYNELRPDFVTMDMEMPGLNGIEAIEAILQLNKTARIVMISSVDNKAKIIEAIKAGARQYILKPVTYDKVLAAMVKLQES